MSHCTAYSYLDNGGSKNRRIILHKRHVCVDIGLGARAIGCSIAQTIAVSIIILLAYHLPAFIYLLSTHTRWCVVVIVGVSARSIEEAREGARLWWL